MTNSINPVSQYFEKTCIDWTSEFALRNAEVIYCPFSSEPDVTDLCASVLSGDELERAAKFNTRKLSAAFIQRRAFRRYCASLAILNTNNLEDGNFEETENGRPFLPHSPSWHFSFSSCSVGCIGTWSNTHSLGVDIEDLGKDVEAIELANRFFSPDEAKLVAQEQDDRFRNPVFLKLWCLKEAALKSIGEGLPFGMEKFQFSLTPNPHLTMAPNRMDTHLMASYLLTKPELIAAIVTCRVG